MHISSLRAVSAVLGAVLLAGCAAAGGGKPASTGTRPASAQPTCTPPFNAGARKPGMLNPAYPAAGLYPAPGGEPHGATGVTLLLQGPALVLDYGQPLESGGVTRRNEVVTGTHSGTWWTAPLAAGYPFRLFGGTVPVFGLVPAPVRTGGAAAGIHDVWLVTEWQAPQTLTVLRGTPALAAALKPWQAVPAVVDAKNSAGAAAAVRAAEASGWKAVAHVAATPACGARPGQQNPFGDRAELQLPLSVPLLLVAPQYGDVVLEVRPG